MLTRFKKQHKREPWHYSQILPKSQIVYPEYLAASRQAEEFHASKKKIRWLFGGDRCGKSGTCVYDNIIDMRRHPDELYWTIPLTVDKIKPVWDWYKVFLAKGELRDRDIVWRNERLDQPRAFKLASNGAMMEFLTAASGPEVFSASNLRQIHIDEDPARVISEGEEIFNECISRTVQGGRIIGSTTPVLGRNWMFRRLVKEMDPQDIDYWHVSLDDNRYISEEEKATQRRMLTQDELGRRYDGIFTTLTGACFKEFRPGVHNLRTRPKISAEWRRIRVIDFGYNHYFYCCWMAMSPRGQVFVYDEYHEKGKLLKYHAQQIWEKTQQHRTMFMDIGNFRPIETNITDHSRQERAELENPDLKEMRLITTPAIKEVASGIQKVNRYLKADEQGMIRLFISPDCPVAQQQCETYHFKKVRDGLEVKEIPDKIDDEAPDTIRYGLEYFDGAPRDYTGITVKSSFAPPAVSGPDITNIASLLD